MRDNLKALGIGVFLSVLLLAILEFTCGQLIRWVVGPLKILAPRTLMSPSAQSFGYEVPIDNRFLKIVRPNPEHKQFEPIFREYPNSYARLRNHVYIHESDYKVRGVSLRDGREVYLLSYEIDANGYRVTPEVNPSANKFAIFLGCSFAYGEGLNGTETLPYFFQKVKPEYRSYNFSFHGYGPHDLLARATSEDARQIVKQKDGVIIYTYMDDQIRRALGTVSYVGTWGPMHPRYVWNGDRLSLAGSFEQSRPLFTSFAKLIASSEIFRFFKMDFPFLFKPSDFRFFASLVGELRDHYEKLFPQSPFYFVFHPQAALFAPNLIPELERLRIHHMDYGGFILGRYTQGSESIDDGHPSAEANQVFAKQLAHDLSNERVQHD